MLAWLHVLNLLNGLTSHYEGFETLKFFATAPHPCSYLEGQEATTLFVEPSTTLTSEQVEAGRIGFR